MITVAEALERLFALVSPVGTESAPLTGAAGRVLAVDAAAQRTQPPFSASAMDGYAVRAEEALAGAALTVIGEAAAGHRFTGPMTQGTTVRIFTGAPVPPEADAILIQEDADRTGDSITVREAPSKGAFIRPAGGDFAQGDTLSAPRRITARDIALLAAMNVAKVTVARKPVVALIPTGDELVFPGEDPGPDQIVSSNNFGLAAMLTAIGAEPRLCPIAPDDPGALADALDDAADADFIVTLGGASVGDHDLVQRVGTDRGLSLDFYKIAMRPGKPLMAGQLGGAVMIGLPGNPVSAMVCGEVFLRPAVEAAMGLPAKPRTPSYAPLAHDLGPGGPREHYMRAELTADGTLKVFENQDSSLLATLARANALVIRHKESQNSPQGSIVPYIPL
ncbi:MAG: gephyrin-like molybdotransferase Glp [Pseudomonadota bacterium]